MFLLYICISAASLMYYFKYLFLIPVICYRSVMVMLLIGNQLLLGDSEPHKAWNTALHLPSWI